MKFTILGLSLFFFILPNSFGQSLNLGVAPFDNVLITSQLSLKPNLQKEAQIGTSVASYVQENVKWAQGLNAFTFCVDLKNDIAILKIENQFGTFNVLFPNLSKQVKANGGDPENLNLINLLEVNVENAKNKYAAVMHFKNAELMQIPFESDLAGGYGQSNTYSFSQFCLNQNATFEFKGVIEISNPLEDYHNNNGLENKISFKLGYNQAEHRCAIATATENDLPEGISISSAYPNPFTQTTTVDFKSSTTTFLTVNIYNVLGQQVSTLFAQEVAAGATVPLRFDATGLTQGLYFMKISSPTFNKTIKLIHR